MASQVQASASSTSPLIYVDDILRQRAQDEPQKPFIAFPKSFTGLDDFELFSARDIDRFVNNAARKLLSHGLNAALLNEPIVAILGLSTLDYIVTMLALSRMGYGLLMLSPRLSVDTYVSLLDKARCDTIIFAPAFSSLVQGIGKRRIVQSYEIVSRSSYEYPAHDLDSLDGNNSLSSPSTIAYILHSSGSTGMPKPIFQAHHICLATFSHGSGSRGFSALPLYHSFGHASFYRALFHRGFIYMYNPNLPLTSGNLVSILETVKPEVMFGVPYHLKLLAESQRGIAALRALKVFASGGSAIPDEIGDLLVKNDVNIVTLFGSTEMGPLMSSTRPKGDKAWDYMRFLPTAKPYIRMIPITGGTYELIVLDGFESKVMSNSDDPPNSFHSRDIFVPHDTIPDAWKYLGRLDDRVTLVNGEKVLPLPIEGRIRQDPLVKEAVVFGVGRVVPGLLVFRSFNAQHLSDEEYISTIWPTVEDANSRSEGFSQISRRSIIPVSANTDYPRTDKGTIIRAQVYRAFADHINSMYERLQGSREGTLKLTEERIQTFLIRTFEKHLGIHLKSLHTEFFSSGLDSLKAINLASEIKKELYLGGNPKKVNQNTVYANQNVLRLAKFLYELSNGLEKTETGTEELDLMTTLIYQNSDFAHHIPGEVLPSHGQLILLTGVTGSLGAHILAQLLPLPQIKHIYCLIRVRPQESPLERLLSSLQSRCINMDSSVLEHKVSCISIDPASSTLGCPPSVLSNLRTHYTTIIHVAWEVNFSLSLASFATNIATTKALLNIALSSQTHLPMGFVFCSSVSAALASPPGSLVPEASLPVETLALPQGYARSKFVAEHIAHNAAQSNAGLDVRILRIGQIAGDTKHGVWNDTEAIPLMIRSATTLGMLPELDEMCSWLPVDRCARAVVELAGLSGGGGGGGTIADGDSRVTDTTGLESPTHDGRGGGARFYNVLHPRSFHWTRDLLPTLKSSRLLPAFDTVPVSRWLRALEKSSNSSEHDPAQNPSVKLLGFWKAKYGRRVDSNDDDTDGTESGGGGSSSSSEGSDNGHGSDSDTGNDTGSDQNTQVLGKDVTFSMECAARDSECLRKIEGFLGQGVMEKILERWMERWEGRGQLKE